MWSDLYATIAKGIQLQHAKENERKKKITLITVLLLLMITLVGCSASTGNGSNYDRQYSNDEITNFVNSYDGKW